MYSWIRRLDILLGSYEKRHGRFRRSKTPGQKGEDYRMKNERRLKKIDPIAVMDLFSCDTEVLLPGMRGQDLRDDAGLAQSA